MTEKRTELFGVHGRILVYVLVMSLFESANAGGIGQAWRIIPATLILGLLLAGMAKKNEFFTLGVAGPTPLPWRNVLFLFPFFIVATANLWHGSLSQQALILS